MAKSKNNATPLIRNKRATFDYTIEERFEAGLELRGWEVKSVRAGRSTINLSHVYVREGELFLCNASFTPADQVCTHEKTEITRTRKLLMHRREIDRLIGKVDRSGYALVPLDLHFKKAGSSSSLRSAAASANLKSATTKASASGSAISRA